MDERAVAFEEGREEEEGVSVVLIVTDLKSKVQRRRRKSQTMVFISSDTITEMQALKEK
jgi:hypothetical protein